MKIKPGETVICYHSLEYSKLIYIFHHIKNFKLILEVEEVYQDVGPCGVRKAYWEKRIISDADGYILSVDELLNEIPKNRPYIVINGTYNIEPLYNENFNDGKVHCVYAGTLDSTKGGAAAAVTAAEFLSDNYHIHILGFGTEEQKYNLLNKLNSIKKKTKCTITYDGLKSGEEYNRFLQKCQVGLCTQIPDAQYINTSFPSKILVYLANGLQVLSIRIPTIENSKIGSYISYYEHQTPEDIAKAIKKTVINQSVKGREILQKLDEQCLLDFKNLLESV